MNRYKLYQAGAADLTSTDMELSIVLKCKQKKNGDM